MRFKLTAVFAGMVGWGVCACAQIRDGGIDPQNLGKGVWIFSMKDATNKLGGHIASVTNINSLMQYYKSVGLRYCIIKSATSDKLFGDCTVGGQLTNNLVNIAHTNGILVFGYNRSFGSNILGEVAMADYVFNRGADGFVFDAEAEWENTTNSPPVPDHPWITNGPAQAWQLCSMVRSNWPNKFLAHAPFPIIYLHNSFPYKEFGYWCDAVMPQIYHFTSAGIKGSPSAAINWTDVNWATWQNSLYALPLTNINGVTVNWTNAIKPIIPVQDVYGEVIAGGIICESAASTVYPDADVMEFMDYAAADPHAQTSGGFRGINYWRADTIGSNQWANIAVGNSGNYSNIVNHLVLDDSAATYVGGWNAVRVFAATTTSPTYYGATGTDTNSFGTNYCYKAQGGGTSYAQFRPNILIPGNYDVFQWHPYLTNASAGTPFVIGTPAGTNTVLANQQTNAGAWSFVGRFNFAAGNSNFIRVLDNFSDAANLAVVDGLKLMYADADLVLDNTNAKVSFAGSWSTGTSATDKYQADYRFATAAASVTATATYRPDFPNAGLYDVFVWHPQGVNRTTNAPWTITFLGGSTNVSVNQQVNGGIWVPLAAALPFAAGTNGFVQLANNAGPTNVMADAVKFSFAAPLVLPTFQAIARQGDGRVQITARGTPGFFLSLDRSTNLSTWQPFTNLLNTNGTAVFMDNNATSQPAGFFRLRQ